MRRETRQRELDNVPRRAAQELSPELVSGVSEHVKPLYICEHRDTGVEFCADLCVEVIEIDHIASGMSSGAEDGHRSESGHSVMHTHWAHRH